MPRHLTYCEPFFGGGSVLFARDPDDERLWLSPHKGVSEVVCDINGELTGFWRVLQGDESYCCFRRIIEAMPFSGVEYADADGDLPYHHAGEVGEAVRFFVRNRQSLAGRMKSFTGITKTRARARMNNEVSAWLSAIDGLLEVHARLKRVLILPPQPAVDVIKKFDQPETLCYIDPPYVHETRATTTEYGEHEMSLADHDILLGCCLASRAKIMLSGYHNDLYQRRLGSWRTETFKIPNQASGAKVKEIKTEVLWMNF